MSLDRSAGLRGRLPVKPPGERLPIQFIHSYLRSPLSPPTYPIDVSGGIIDWKMLGNGPDPTLSVNGGRPVGDCTFAARQHLRMAKAAAAGTVEQWETSNQLVAEYLAYDHGADRGANIAEVLLSWFLAGKIRAFAPVDYSDPAGCDAVMASFHGLYVGVDLTADANREFDAGQAWTLQQGEQPDPSDGHCVVKVMADGHQFDTWVTWGALQQSTRPWTAGCVREAWAIVTAEDEAEKLDMASLLCDIVAAVADVARKAGTTATGSGGRAQALGATAFALGWQMAQAYGPLAADVPAPATDHLPTVAEYGGPARWQLAVEEIKSLLIRAGWRGLDGGGLDAWVNEDPTRRTAAVLTLHYGILDALVGTDRALAASYQLGGALSDACWIPDTHDQPPARSERVHLFLAQFSRDRLATLQGWLAEMNAFAPQAAPIVSRSLQNWSDWIDTNRHTLQGHWAENEAAIVSAVRSQSQAWHGWLSSPTTNAGEPPLGAWIHAGEQVLRTSKALATRMLRWFWPVVVVILAVTGALLYLALNNASGTAKVWTSLVTVAGSAGVSLVGLRSGAKKLGGGLEETMWKAATADAQAWALTWLPSIKQSRLTRYRLRIRGVDPPTGATRPGKPGRHHLSSSAPPRPRRSDPESGK
jgi:hypothetical protein